MSAIDEIRARAAAATPGPWCWTATKRGEVDLVAAVSGIPYVMGFRRHGMNGAQPVFADGRDMAQPGWRSGLMRTVAEIGATPAHLAWPQQRVEIANPDATFLTAVRADVETLLAEIDRLTSELAYQRALRAEDPDYEG